MKKKILLAILTILIFIGVGVGYTYYTTDIFKTEKEMFFTYILEDNILNKFEDKRMIQYAEKQKNTPFKNEGEISLNFDAGEEIIDKETKYMLNNSKITIEGKCDLKQKLSEQTITANFAQAFTIPVNFILDGNALGIQSGFLHTKFLAVKNENLDELFEKLGIEDEEIPEKIEITNEEFTTEEIETIKNKYFSIITDNLEPELFTKEKIENQMVLTLKMKEQKFSDILVKILETAKNDETILNKLTAVIEKEEIQSEIESMIEDIKDTKTNEDTILEIKLYIEDKDIVKYAIIAKEKEEIISRILIEDIDNKVNIKIYEEKELCGDITIIKETIENNLTYTMSMKIYDDISGDGEIKLKAQYKNLDTLEDVKEKYEVTIEFENTDEYEEPTGEMTELTIKYDVETDFSDNLEIERLTEENAIILNDQTEEELQDLILTIYQKLGLI